MHQIFVGLLGTDGVLVRRVDLLKKMKNMLLSFTIFYLVNERSDNERKILMTEAVSSE